MPDQPGDLSKIQHVQTGGPVAGPYSSQPTRALELRVQRLEQLISEQAQGTEINRLVIRNVAIKTGDGAPGLWDVVYYNAGTGLYEAAQAGVTFSAGVFLFNATALAAGLLIAINGTLGDVMIAGYEQLSDLDSRKTSMLEPTEIFRAGVPYFLSADYPGKLTRFAPPLKVQVLIATDQDFILQLAYSNPEAIENIYQSPVGMRPVGSTRMVLPDYNTQIVVGFDALELIDADQQIWQTTRESTLPAHRDFGYLVADATVLVQPVDPIYIRVQVAIGGAVKVFSADTLADLFDTSSQRYNESILTALVSNKDTLRLYSVRDSAATDYGTLAFKFTDNETTKVRHLIFKFPDFFQGWKMINAPITPLAEAVLKVGAVNLIKVLEGSVGYVTPPQVLLDGDGSGATAVAVLNDAGTIVRIDVTAGGTGYTTPPEVVFKQPISAVKVLNGGSGATGSATVSGGDLDSVAISTAGTGYFSAPSVEVLDTGGPGAGARVTAESQNGAVTKLKIVSPGIGYVTPILKIKPNNEGYSRTKTGVFVVVLGGGAVTSVTVSDGGINYPQGAVAKISGDGIGAVVVPVIDGNGTVTSFSVSAAGTGYTVATVAVDQFDPAGFMEDGNPLTPAHVTLQTVSQYVDHVEVLSSGIGYGAFSTVTVTGNAVLLARLDGSGRILSVDVVDRGSGYDAVPVATVHDYVDIFLNPGTAGNGAVLRIVLGTEITGATVVDGGDFSTKPFGNITVPISHVEIDDPGEGYVSAPAVSFSAPDDPDGVTAAGTALMGQWVDRVIVTSAGTGYSTGTTIALTGGGATVQATLKLSISAGTIVHVAIIDPGYGYSGTPAVVLGSTGGGSGAVLTVQMIGSGGVAKIAVTVNGKGYANPPLVTIAPPLSGLTAVASAKLKGTGAMLEVVLAGEGGLRVAQSGDATLGNKLQVRDFNDDLNDSTEVVFARPPEAVFYYNVGADPNFLSRYPSLPIDKTLFLLNGVELSTTVTKEGSGLAQDNNRDIFLSRKTIFWPKIFEDGLPWDRAFQHFVLLFGASGRDHIIPKTGLAGFEDGWWRLVENTFLLEPEGNKAWVHINKASRFHQSSRVSGLAALAPLKLIDASTGEVSADGRLVTGQLLIALDDQVNFLGGSGDQIDLTRTGDLQVIYVNNTGRNVFISSVILIVTFQTNQGDLSPTVASCAKITVGTQAGNYRDIVGVLDDNTSEGTPTRLFVSNQAKELFPDDDQAYVLIAPNQAVYLRVDSPAGTPISKQIAVAHLKGHVF